MRFPIERLIDATKPDVAYMIPAHWRIKSTKRDWTPDQDEFILEHSLEMSMEYLKRSKSSVQTRLWRLNKNV